MSDTRARALSKIDRVNMRKKVYRYLKAHGSKTGSEVAEGTGLFLITVRARLTELSRVRDIWDSGKRRRNSRGNTEIVWSVWRKS